MTNIAVRPYEHPSQDNLRVLKKLQHLCRVFLDITAWELLCLDVVTGKTPRSCLVFSVTLCAIDSSRPLPAVI